MFIEILKILVDLVVLACYLKGKLLFMAVEMQFKTRVSTLAVRICIIHTETRQIPRSFHYNPIPGGVFRGKLNGVREMFTVSVTFYSTPTTNFCVYTTNISAFASFLTRDVIPTSPRFQIWAASLRERLF